MPDPTDLRALIENGTLDAEMIDQLTSEDPEKIRALLAKYLPDAEVDAVLARLQALGEARKAQSPGSTKA